MWRPRKSGSTTFYPLITPNLWKEIDYLHSFLAVPELNAVISMKARCFSNGVIKTVNANGDEVDKLPEVIRKPNWFQDIKEFMRQTKLFHEIYGDEYIYNLTPVGMPQNAKALFTIPPNLVCAEYLEDQPFFVFPTQPDGVKYFLEENGRKTEIDSSQIIHMNDNNVSVFKSNGKNILNGESRMKGLRAAIVNIKMAYESRGIILKYRGALGILSNQTTDGVGAGLPIDEKEIKEIQDAYRRYGGLEDQASVIITSANLRWQQMTVNPDKLGLFQETKEDFAKILDGYGMPPELFSEKDATFENKRQARKAAYENTIIPEANEWIRGLNDFYFPDPKGVKMIVDFMHLPIFQEDLKARADTLASLVNSLSKLLQDGQITDEEYRKELFKLGLGDGKALPEPEPEEVIEPVQPINGQDDEEETNGEPAEENKRAAAKVY